MSTPKPDTDMPPANKRERPAQSGAPFWQFDTPDCANGIASTVAPQCDTDCDTESGSVSHKNCDHDCLERLTLADAKMGVFDCVEPREDIVTSTDALAPVVKVSVDRKRLKTVFQCTWRLHPVDPWEVQYLNASARTSSLLLQDGAIDAETGRIEWEESAYEGIDRTFPNDSSVGLFCWDAKLCVYRFNQTSDTVCRVLVPDTNHDNDVDEQENFEIREAVQCYESDTEPGSVRAAAEADKDREFLMTRSALADLEDLYEDDDLNALAIFDAAAAWLERRIDAVTKSGRPPTEPMLAGIQNSLNGCRRMHRVVRFSEMVLAKRVAFLTKMALSLGKTRAGHGIE